MIAAIQFSPYWPKCAEIVCYPCGLDRLLPMKRVLHDVRDVLSAQSGQSPLPRDLVRALAWLEQRLSKPTCLHDIAAAAGVPARTLETHFKAYLGTTPLGWLRHARLARAREELLRNRSAGVTEIALASGFNQLGRFARDYRALYGERPSDTRVRAPRTSGVDDPIDDEAALLAWRALSSAYFVAPKECGRALDDVERAQEIAPHFGLPKGIMAWCNGQRAAFNFGGSSHLQRAEIARLAEHAVALTPNDPLTLSVCSGAMALAHRLNEADRMIERAIALSPLSPVAWVRRGWVSVYLGDGDNAVREFRVLLHMMPFEPMAHLAYIGIGCTHFAAERYERALRWTREGVESHPGSFWADRIAVAAAVHCGARAEAKRIARRLMRKDPALTVTGAREAMPFEPAFLERLGDGLKRADVPLH
jgi:AraC-like DNA-binding protein